MRSIRDERREQATYNVYVVTYCVRRVSRRSRDTILVIDDDNEELAERSGGE